MPTNKELYRLKILGLPPIESIEDLADKTRLSVSKLRYISYRSDYLYRVYQVPKKTTGSRTIAQPNRELKSLQAWILRNILDRLTSSPHCKGFERGSSILENALPHLGANYILNIDLENFFPTVKASRIFNIFYSIGYNEKISSMLTNICTYKGGLPQGAPSSPKLSNLACYNLDSRLHGYAGANGLVYTRYADDITLSSQTFRKINRANEFVKVVIKSEGYIINDKKTLIVGTQRQKNITGLVISQNSVGIGRKKYRFIRSIIYNLYTTSSDKASYINGYLAFTHSVDKKMYDKLHQYIDQLNKRFPNNNAHTLLAKKIIKNSY